MSQNFSCAQSIHWLPATNRSPLNFGGLEGHLILRHTGKRHVKCAKAELLHFLQEVDGKVSNIGLEEVRSRPSLLTLLGVPAIAVHALCTRYVGIAGAPPAGQK